MIDNEGAWTLVTLLDCWNAEVFALLGSTALILLEHTLSVFFAFWHSLAINWSGHCKQSVHHINSRIIPVESGGTSCCQTAVYQNPGTLDAGAKWRFWASLGTLCICIDLLINMENYILFVIIFFHFGFLPVRDTPCS